jgi:DNA invertase Pin-like site-specific DNA recombinase
MLIDYARVSTLDQNLDLQTDSLRTAGCERVFSDRTSGARADRPGLRDALEYVREGDVVVVWKCDRLSRSLSHLVETVQNLERRGIGFRSLTEGVDSTSPGGRAIFPIFAALSAVEKNLIQERTRAGLAAARQRGRIGGRPKVMTGEKIQAAIKLLATGTPPRDVAAILGVSIPTLYRHLPVSRRGIPLRSRIIPISVSDLIIRPGATTVAVVMARSHFC